MEQKQRSDLLGAFFDGFDTGLDIGGLVLGYLTLGKHKDDPIYYRSYPEYYGFMCDKHGISCCHESDFDVSGDDDLPPLRYHPPHISCEPAERTILEQIAKGVGDFVGIAVNIAFAGLPTISRITSDISAYRERMRRYADIDVQ